MLTDGQDTAMHLHVYRPIINSGESQTPICEWGARNLMPCVSNGN